MPHPEVLAIKRYAPIVLICVVLGAASAALVAMRSPHRYESQVVLFVAATRTPNSGSAYDRALFAQDRVRSYVPMVSSPEVLDMVIRSLPLNESASQLAGKLTVTAAPDTVLLTITVREGSPVLAQRVASEVAHQFTTYVTALEGTYEGQPNVQLTITRPAQLNPDPVSPNVLLDAWIGAFFGGVIGLAITGLHRRWSGGAEGEAAIADVPPPSMLRRRRAVEQ